MSVITTINNALAYATMKNTYAATDATATQLADFSGNNLLTNISRDDGTPAITNDQKKRNALDTILKDTTLKRACCQGIAGTVNSIKVRIPLPKDTDDTSKRYFEQKFGYYDVDIQVPPR